MNHRFSVRAGTALFAGLLLTPFALAQDPDGPAPVGRRHAEPAPAFDQAELAAGQARHGMRMPSLRTKIHTAEGDMGQPYGIWAAGDTYKASFHGGMTFVPYLGEDYPHNQPLAWRTTSARLGELELLGNEAPTTAQQDHRFEYRFGAITEAYDVLAEGLEQTFVLHQRPAVGDLVITGAVDSLLRARNVAPAHQELRFCDAEGRELVGYGRAFAIDARGARIDLCTGHQDGKITLTVPSDWLANAAMPVVVDPLLTRVVSGTLGGQAAMNVDVARDDVATADNVLTVYTRAASATDGDVWARLSDDDWSGSSMVFTDITSSWDTDEVVCAFVGGSQRWAIAMRRYFPNNATRVSQLRCHVRDSGDTTLSTSYGSMVPPAGSNEWRVDIGGVESYATGSNALVVFQREDNSGTGNHFASTSNSDVFGCLLDTTTTNGTFGTPFAILSGTTFDNERPSVNKVAEGGAAFSWICVLQSYNNSLANDDWDLIGRRIDHTGAIAASNWISDLALAGEHQLGPVVEGQGGRYAVAFTTTDLVTTPFKTSVVAGQALRVERFDWAHGASAPSGDRAPVTLRSNVDRRWEASGLGYDTRDDSHFAVGFRAVAPGVPSAYYARVGFGGAPTEGPVGSYLYYVANETTTGAACVFDNDAQDFLFAYGVDDGGSQPVYGHTLEYATPATWTTAGTACSNATIGWSGNQQIGAEFNRIVVSGAPAAAGHFLMVSLGTTNVPVIDPAVFPGCRLLVQAAGPAFLGTMPFAFGPNVSWALPLPEWLDPMTLHFQDWQLDGSLFYSTQRLSVPIVK